MNTELILSIVVIGLIVWNVVQQRYINAAITLVSGLTDSTLTAVTNLSERIAELEPDE